MDRHEVSEALRENVFTKIQGVSKDRKESYGPAEESFQRIAYLWTGYLKAKGFDITITPTDVAFLMVQFKMAREMNKHDFENILDGTNYFSFGGGFNAANELEKKIDMQAILEDDDFEGVGKDPEPGEVIFVPKEVSASIMDGISSVAHKLTRGGSVRG